MEWNVPIHGIRTSRPTYSRMRERISSAALFVNVTAAIPRSSSGRPSGPGGASTRRRAIL